MAELDPLVTEILLKGDDEFLSKLKKVGEDAAEKFENLSKSVNAGAGSAEALTGSLGLIVGAVTAATAATTAFIEKQTELSQKTELLAQAFGTTSGQIQDLETTFASAGVKVDQFERFANRLTITIAREWPQIAESIKNYANENDAAQLRVQNSIIKVSEAQKALGDRSEERASQMVRDNQSVEAAYIKLQFAAQHAASEQQAAALSVRGAQLSEQAALQNLAELEGRPVSPADKQALAISQARQAVDSARKATADALLAQQEKAATAALNQAKAEQEYDDLRRKAAKNARDDAEQRQKDENAVKEAVIARGEAEARASKFALTNVASIRDALDGIVKGNKGAATQIDLTQVSVKHLTDAIIAQGAEIAKNGKAPSGYEGLVAISRTFAADTEHLISTEQRLAVVNRLAGTSMTALGASASEILHVLEHDSEAIEHLTQATKSLDTKEAKAAIEDFRGALAKLDLAISILSQRFAIAASPVFTRFLIAVRESLESSNGVLHIFIEGLTEIGRVIGRVGEGLNVFAGWVAKAFNVEPATVWKTVLVTLGVLIAATATALLAWPLILAGITTAIGYIAQNWDKVKTSAENAWAAVKDTGVYKFLDGVIEKIKAAYDWWKQLGIKNSGSANGGNSPEAAGGGGNTEAAPSNLQGLAGGGPVRGPGTTTSDSVLARLSRGEFVVKAAAVQAYGANLFHSLNNMMIPGLATGGLVASPVRMGGSSSPATSVLNLSLDGRSFNGFRGPKSTVDDLSSFAIARQTSAAGKRPSWVG